MLFCGFLIPRTQEKDTLSYAEQLALLEAELDSMSIFNLIDSLFDYEITPSSELNLRFGFTSSVTSAGRDYDLNQQGYAPGIAYYHKKGLYLDLSGYWSSDVSPQYNPTILGIGYLGQFNQKLTYSLDYEKWFFNPQDTSLNPLTNSVGASVSYDFNIGYVNVDYAYLFGEESSNRLIGNLTGNINFGKWWVFNSVSIYPTATILFGDGNVTLLRITQQTLRDAIANRILAIDSFDNLTTEETRTLRNLILTASENSIISERERNTLIRKTVTGEPLTEEDLASLSLVANGIYRQERYIDESKFGLLSYAFSIPLALSSDRLSFLLSYTYSIPVELPGESLIELDPIGYFGISVSYRIPFKPRGSRL